MIIALKNSLTYNLQDKVPADSELAYLLHVAETVPPIKSILFMTLINQDHYVLFEHNILEGRITCHNSLQSPAEKSVQQSCYEGYDIFSQKYLSCFFSVARRSQGLAEVVFHFIFI